MSKIEKPAPLETSKKALAQGAFLAHIDVCRACCMTSDKVRLWVESGKEGEIVVREITYDLCQVGGFLKDVWAEVL